MAKPADVLRRVIALLEGGKIKDSDVHDILNGAVINGDWVYINGDYTLDGRRHVLSADRITSIVWPKKETAPQPKAPPKVETEKKGTGL